MNEDAPNVLNTPGYPLLISGPLMLVLIILGGLALWWLWRKRQLAVRGGGAALQIQITATRPLGARSHLAIVEAAGSRSLIATTPQGVQFLRDLPVEAEKVEKGFDTHLSQAGEEPNS
jgi:flagellar biogenesis protein FliO